VVEYECAQGYLFEEGSKNSIGCEAKIEDGVIKTGWSSTSQIRCTPSKILILILFTESP
jgi:hypothetical protein